jgi:DNA (cytosine-5)-methyltransferase 1
MANQQEALRELALFAGAGGGILGGKLLGWRTVCAVEWDAYAASVLVARQNDGCLDPFPIWDKIQDFDGRPWRGCVDVVSGGFPCQDISCAGKGAGIDGERSGMWKHMARIIGEVRPQYAFVENSPMLTVRGLGTVLGDLAEMGYDARWCVLGADTVGADHHRARLWVVADSDMRRCEKRGRGSVSVRPKQTCTGNYRKEVERPLCGMDDGVAHWVDRLKAAGNGQVPSVAKLAWETLKEE